jgi:hypothetical protein
MRNPELDELKRRIATAPPRESHAQRLQAAYMEKKRSAVAMLDEVYDGIEYIGGQLVACKPVSGDVSYEARTYSFRGVTVALDFAPGFPSIQVKGTQSVIGVFEPPNAIAVLEAITTYVAGPACEDAPSQR